MSTKSRPHKRAPLADPKAREHLRKADPVLARLIDERPDFRPRAWTEELPPFDAFGTLVFQVAGQQLSVASTRAIIRHLEDRFGGLMLECPQRDSNPRYSLERAVTWAASRWGPRSESRDARV